MQEPEQEQQPESRGREKPGLLIIVIVAVILGLIALSCFIASLTILVLNNLGLLKIPPPNHISAFFNTAGIVFGAFSVAIAIFRNFISWVLAQMHPGTNKASSSSTPAYSGISSLPSPTHPRAILQRERDVEAIYEMLTRPEITAVVLTGIAGIGKSTLAALLYQYIEKQKHQRWRIFHRDQRLFTARPLWLKVDASTKMAGIAATLFKEFGVPMPADFSTLPPQTQAAKLTMLLKTAKKRRLIVLDQFDTLFDIHNQDDIHNQHPQREYDRVGEWLDTLNSQQCNSKILFTSSSWLQGTRVHPRTHMQEYHVQGVSVAEGTELLRKHELQGTEAEVRTIIEISDGHMLAMTELINLLQTYQLTLTAFLNSDSYFPLWRRNIALHLMRDLYTKQLGTLERRLLSAFATYHIPVPLEAAEVILDTNVARYETLAALNVLLAQHLLKPAGGGDFEPHPLVAHYIRHDLEETDELSNYLPTPETHARAATYCLQQAKKTCPPQGQRNNSGDIRFLTEAIRHLCRSGECRRAYNLIRSEHLFTDLKRWKESKLLLALYQLLSPPDKWCLNKAQAARIYGELGEILTDLINTAGIHREEALQSFKRSYALYTELNSDPGKCSILRKMGLFYLEQQQYSLALAFFLQAGKLAGKTRSSSQGNLDRCEERMISQIGKERYDALLRKVEPQAEQMVEPILR